MSIIHRATSGEQSELRWQDVPVRAYGSGNSSTDKITCQILLGNEEGSQNFHLRYFSVQPGGYTSLDQHMHERGVYVLHGRALLRLGEEEHELGPGDVVYISGNEIHQFFALDVEPLGFLCIVPAQH
jgi:quercetin dioxygenase-like cupin family protein